MKHSKKCPQYHLMGYIRIKEQLNNGKSHYGQWTWSLDTTWMDDELHMMDWLKDGCFPLFYLLTYFINGTSKNFWKFSRILFFRKSYNPSNDLIVLCGCGNSIAHKVIAHTVRTACDIGKMYTVWNLFQDRLSATASMSVLSPFSRNKLPLFVQIWGQQMQHKWS